MNSAAKYTHYSYLICPVPPYREPTGIYDFDGLGEEGRRVFIHNMLENGELVAPLPFPEITTMRQLRGALKWEDGKRES